MEVLLIGHFVFSSAVRFQFVFCCAGKWTDGARKWLFAGVDSQMSFQPVRTRKRFDAIQALPDGSSFLSWLVSECRLNNLVEKKLNCRNVNGQQEKLNILVVF